MNNNLYTMSYTLDTTEMPHRFLIDGEKLRSMRTKYNISFTEFCLRSTLSTRTLAGIEKSAWKLVTETTLLKLLEGFNQLRNRRRRKQLSAYHISEYMYTRGNHYLPIDPVGHTRVTVYLNNSIHWWVMKYAEVRHISKNQAISELLKEKFSLFEEHTKRVKMVPMIQLLG